MQEAGMSNKGLARRIVDTTAAWTEPLRADHNDVRKWLDGMVPRDPKPRVIAEVLSAKLGRRLSLDDLGLGESDTSEDDALVTEGLAYQTQPGRAVDLLRQLTDADLSDRRRVVNATWCDDVAPQIITGYLFAGPVVLIPDDEGPIRGATAAERIRRTTAHLMDMDFQFGGGHTRRMLIQFFRDQVVPLLRKHHPEPIRREIFSAAAEAAQLLGWSAYDAGRHGVAMRYFTQGLKLAREADDHMLGARMLSSLSHQANYLGRYNDAVSFARAAQSATLGRATKTVSAMFLAMEARALASLGDKAGTAAALNHAERFFEAREISTEPEWINYFDALELAGEAAHCFRDLGDGRRAKLFTAQAIDPVLTPSRTRAFIQMVSAAGSLANGEPYEAITLATEAVELADGLQSMRYLRYLTDFRKALNDLKVGRDLSQGFTELLRSRYPKLAIPPAAA
jgi:tetratricopeptide (TPR) repeat protein